MPTIFIDGKEYEVGEGRNVLQAALDNKLDLPYFCWHPAMGSVGACRLCAVRHYRDETDEQGRLVMGCMTPAGDGTRVSIADPEAAQFRRSVIEWLMINHPHDCPVCDEGGECHLQDMTVMTGHAGRRYRGRKRTHRNQYLGPLIHHEMNRCIQCYRCVRFYREHSGGDDLGVFASRSRVYFGRVEEGVLESPFSGNLVEVCPTGVFTDKTLRSHYARKWDLQQAPSVCTHCSLGCNNLMGARYGSARRVTSRYNGQVNGYWLCDRGRFGYEHLNADDRLRSAQSPRGAVGDDMNATPERIWGSASEAVIRAAGRGSLAAVGSPRGSLETNFALRSLAGAERFCAGMAEEEHRLVSRYAQAARRGDFHVPALGDIERADVVIVAGSAPTHEAPLLDLALYRAHEGSGAAIHFVGLSAARIESFARSVAFGDADQSAERLEAVAAALRSADDGNPLAADLRASRTPLLVTGTQHRSTRLLDAVLDLADALSAGRDATTWVALAAPEANSMGANLLDEHRGMSVAALLEAIEGDRIDTLIVAENDLFMRFDDTHRLGEALERLEALVVLDHMVTPTVASASHALPVAAVAESNGTLVNNEGRMQRFYQVLRPAADIVPSWSIVRDLTPEPGCDWQHVDEVTAAIEAAAPVFAGAGAAAPPAGFRHEHQSIPRMSRRYSGRNATLEADGIDARVTGPDPSTGELPMVRRESADPETPFAFSMEGFAGHAPPALMSRVWSPGWNSNEAINQFQIEVGGPLHGGDPGVRIFGSEPSAPPAGPRSARESVQRDGNAPDTGDVLVCAAAEIFGSEETARRAPALAELAPEVYIAMHPERATALGLEHGDQRRIRLDGAGLSVRLAPTVVLESTLPSHVVVIPGGYPETRWWQAPVWMTFEAGEVAS